MFRKLSDRIVSMPLIDKSIEIDLRPNTDFTEEELRFGPDVVHRLSKHESITPFVFTISVDGKPVISMPNIREFTIENPHLFAEISTRLDLLAKILTAAEAYGNVLVQRTSVGTYEVADPGSFTIMSNDREDDD